MRVRVGGRVRERGSASGLASGARAHAAGDIGRQREIEGDIGRYREI